MFFSVGMDWELWYPFNIELEKAIFKEDRI